MNDVVKLLYRVTIAILGTSAAIAAQTHESRAQDDGWTPVERCAALPSAAPEQEFDGLLVMVADDAARVFRSGVSTTYVLSFSGGNFLSAGAVSPDGRYFAVPNGVINTISSSDVRYVVQELRIVTTETVPRIVKRLPWRASFPVGTRFTSSGDIPTVRWLDATTIQFVSGTMSEGQTSVVVDVLGESVPEPAGTTSALSVSPDSSRSVSIVSGNFALIDATSGEIVSALSQVPSSALQIAWSPDSARFAMTEIDEGRVLLVLYDLDGERLDEVDVLPAEQVLWNLRWSPDGSRIAYSAFDPQTIENRLHVVDLNARTVTDTCLPVLADVDGKTLSVLAWSPDSSRLALITDQGTQEPQIQIYDVTERTRYRLLPAAGRFLGWYP